MGKPINWGYVAGGLGNALMQYMLAKDQNDRAAQERQDRLDANEEWQRRFDAAAQLGRERDYRRFADKLALAREKNSTEPVIPAVTIGGNSYQPMTGYGHDQLLLQSLGSGNNDPGTFTVTTPDGDTVPFYTGAGADTYQRSLHKEPTPGTPPKPVDPDIALGRRLTNEKRISDYYDDHYPMTPEAQWLVQEGLDERARLSFLDMVTDQGMKQADAMQRLAGMIGTLPTDQGYYWKDHDDDPSTLDIPYKKTEGSWKRLWRDGHEPVEGDAARALAGMLLGGLDVAPPHGGAPEPSGGQPDPQPGGGAPVGSPTGQPGGDLSAGVVRGSNGGIVGFADANSQNSGGVPSAAASVDSSVVAPRDSSVVAPRDSVVVPPPVSGLSALEQTLKTAAPDTASTAAVSNAPATPSTANNAAETATQPGGNSRQAAAGISRATKKELENNNITQDQFDAVRSAWKAEEDAAFNAGRVFLTPTDHGIAMAIADGKVPQNVLARVERAQ